MCNSELVFCARSAAVLAASSASLEPSVAKGILGGKLPIVGCPLPKRGRPLGQPRRVVQRHHGSKHEVLGASPYGLSLYARWLLLVANFSELRHGEVRRIPLLRTRVNK